MSELVYANEDRSIFVSGSSAILTSNKPSISDTDQRIVKLKKFLMKYNSPLTELADYIIALADIYEVDWRLVTAISGVESTFCKKIPYKSYNCWGWNNGNYFFSSFIDGLQIITKSLSENYYQKGYNIPETIAPIYAPPSNTWARKVRSFMKEIEASQLNNELKFHI